MSFITPGKQYGDLTAIKKTEKQQGRNFLWLFRCKCGNEIELRSSNARNAKQAMCQTCREKVKAKVFSVKIGERYGALVCAERKQVGKKTFFKFKCDCGNEVTRQGYLIHRMLYPNCGCIRKSETVRIIDAIAQRMRLGLTAEKMGEAVGCSETQALKIMRMLKARDEESAGIQSQTKLLNKFIYKRAA